MVNRKSIPVDVDVLVICEHFAIFSVEQVREFLGKEKNKD